MIELRPCPFCGSKDIDKEGWSNGKTSGPACNKCGGSAGNVSESNDKNIAAWNHRLESLGEAAAVVCLVTDRYAHGNIVEVQLQLASPDAPTPRVGDRYYTHPPRPVEAKPFGYCIDFDPEDHEYAHTFYYLGPGDVAPEYCILLYTDPPKPQAESVAVYQFECDGNWVDCTKEHFEGHDGSEKRILYTHPPKPIMSDSEVALIDNFRRLATHLEGYITPEDSTELRAHIERLIDARWLKP